MPDYKKIIILLNLYFLITFAAEARSQNEYGWVKNALERSEDQLLTAAEKYKCVKKNPRTFENGIAKFAGTNDWTCGFFPGTLWYMFEITKDDKFKN